MPDIYNIVNSIRGAFVDGQHLSNVLMHNIWIGWHDEEFY